MRTRQLFTLFSLILVNAISCGDDGGKQDAGAKPGDAGSDIDASASDAGRGDAGASPGSDAGHATRTDAGGTSSNSDSGAKPGDAGGGGGGQPQACDPSAAPTIPSLALQAVVTGLSGVVFAAQPPDSSDWYLVEQKGTIRVFSNGQLASAPFLDVSSEIQVGNGLPPNVDDERGLLGLAFPPDYATSGKFYVMMTPSTGANVNRDTVREYQRSANDPHVADMGSMKTLFQLDASDYNHDGGNVVFGPDGKLYVGTGDGGGMCNSSKPGAPQSTSALFGKILRLDPAAAAPNYAAAGNPFASGGDPRVWQYGLRNPYRFSFDRMTGDLYIGDVGQDSYEELDFAASSAQGLDFGWPVYEGKHPGCMAGAMLATGATATDPIFEVDRRRGQTGDYADWVSIIGGHVYRGSAIPALQGVYVFGDYKGKRMAALMQCSAQTSKVTPILKNRDPNATNSASFARASGDPVFNQLTAIVEDNQGELYFVANFDRLLKVVPGQ